MDSCENFAATRQMVVTGTHEGRKVLSDRQGILSDLIFLKFVTESSCANEAAYDRVGKINCLIVNVTFGKQLCQAIGVWN